MNNSAKGGTLEDIELPAGVTIDEEKYKQEQAERYLQAASNFLQRSFEYARPSEEKEVDLIDLSDDETESKQAKEKKWESLKANVALNPNQTSVMDLATFRMIILADETYEMFFAHTLRNSIHVDEKIGSRDSRGGALRNMFDGFLADGKRVASQVRRRVDSVATKNSSSSGSAAEATDIQDEVDDFTSGHTFEHDDLLKHDLISLEDNEGNEPNPESQRKKLESFSFSDPSETREHSLIEFEA